MFAKKACGTGRVPLWLALALLLIPAAACKKRPAPVAAPVPSPPAPVLTELDLADLHFQAGDYQQAADSYQAVLDKEPLKASSTDVLYRLALARLLLTPEDREGARLLLDQYLSQDPPPAQGTEARLLATLLDELKKMSGELQEKQKVAARLARELEKMKAIDLRKRP